MFLITNKLDLKEETRFTILWLKYACKDLFSIGPRFFESLVSVLTIIKEDRQIL